MLLLSLLFRQGSRYLLCVRDTNMSCCGLVHFKEERAAHPRLAVDDRGEGSKVLQSLENRGEK